ncbi:MAG TPA: S1 family peptidase, partial [Mycobacteriales bacterium]
SVPDAVEAAAAALVRDVRIPMAEALARVHRQGRLQALADRLREQLGASFGGAWIDQAHSGRLTVAVLDADAATRVRQAAERVDLSDTAVVRARRAAADLDRTAQQLGMRAAVANQGARFGLEVSVAVVRNTVELRVPAGVDLTPAQLRLVTSVRGRRDGPVVLDTYTGQNVPQSCPSRYACDPPLRSGLAIYTGGARCTSGFLTGAAGRYYLLTAGHCTGIAPTWAAVTATHGMRLIGPRVHSVFGRGGDMGLIRIDYPTFWQAAAMVYPQHPIRSVGTALVGATVCKTGSTSGLTCGLVTRVNATVYYPGRTVTGLTVTTACSAPGDSGAGVWSGSTAYGLLSGGPRHGCGMVYQPVPRAEHAFGVRVLLDRPGQRSDHT